MMITERGFFIQWLLSENLTERFINRNTLKLKSEKMLML